MMRGWIVVSVLSASIVVGATSLAAQVPGASIFDRDEVRAQFIAEVMAGVNEANAAWEQAWREKDVRKLVESYTKNAVLLLPGATPARGSSEIESALQSAADRNEAYEVFTLDVDASGSMAMIYGTYRAARRIGSGGTRQVSGPFVTVFTRLSGHWRIRSQMFGPEDIQP